MTSVAAVYGLIGVVGGAAIGALAAIYGPLRLHRQQTKQKTMDQQAQQAQEEIARLLRMRTTGRAWLDALEQTAQELEAQTPIDLHHFDEMIIKLRADATEASHALAHDSRWMESYDTQDIPVPPEHLGSEVVARSELIGLLRNATRIIRAEILQQSQPQRRPVRSESYYTLNDVRAARAKLNAALLENIEQINQKRAQRL